MKINGVLTAIAVKVVDEVLFSDEDAKIYIVNTVIKR